MVLITATVLPRKGKEKVGNYNQFKSVQLQFPEKYWNK